MRKYLFSQSEAVELFCRILIKYEKELTQTSFNDLKVLNKYLDQAERVSYCEKINSAIIKFTEEKDFGGKVFYELSRNIRYEEVFTASGSTIDVLEKYLADPHYYIPRTEIKKWTPSVKKMNYEGTKWAIYAFDELVKIEENNNLSITPVVNRGLLLFKPFGKVEITSYNIKTQALEKYSGEFHLYGDGRYFLFDLKTDDAAEKNLKLEFFIGSDNVVSIALGQYHNIDGAIYSGTVIIVNETSNSKEIPIGCYNSAVEEEKILISDYIWEYFSDKRFNNLRVPGKINTIPELAAWLKSKRTHEVQVAAKIKKRRTNN